MPYNFDEEGPIAFDIDLLDSLIGEAGIDWHRSVKDVVYWRSNLARIGARDETGRMNVREKWMSWRQMMEALQ